MASVTYGNVVYGLRDLKITNIGGTVQEDLGAAVTLTVQPQFKGGMLEGDDAIKAQITFIIGATGDFSAGEISSEALAIMTGKALTTSGTTPNEITELKLDEGDNMPYFKCYGQALDEASGDVHVLLSKVKLTALEALALENGNFRMTSATIQCLDDGTNGAIKLLQHETATALPSS